MGLSHLFRGQLEVRVALPVWRGDFQRMQSKQSTQRPIAGLAIGDLPRAGGARETSDAGKAEVPFDLTEILPRARGNEIERSLWRLAHGAHENDLLVAVGLCAAFCLEFFQG